MKQIFVFILAISLFSGYQVFSGEPGNPLNPAKTVTITGVVTDYNSGEVLAGAVVQLEGTPHKAFTNLDGEFSITFEAQNSVNLKVDYISYEGALVKDLNLSAAKNPLHVKLLPK